jgi:hypothetical protein
MIGEIEALLDGAVDIDWPAFTRAFPRLQHDVLDDRVSALAVLDSKPLLRRHVCAAETLAAPFGHGVQRCVLQKLRAAPVGD